MTGRPTKTPTAHRSFIVLAVTATMGLPVVAGAQESIRESAFVTLALERSRAADLTRAEAEAARAEGVEQGLWQNPELAYDREELFEAEVEQTLTLSQEIPLTGIGTLAERAGKRRAQAAELRGVSRDARFAASARETFAVALASEQRVRLIEGWVDRLEQGRDLVDARLRAGDASALDAMRAEREVRRAKARLDQARARRDGARARLGQLAGVPVVPQGDLIDGPLLEAPDWGTTPSARATAADVEAVEIELEAQGRRWIPSLGLSLGVRRSFHDGDAVTGLVAGASVSLPIFDRGQAGSARLEAERARLLAARERELQELRAAWGAHYVRAQRLRIAAVSFADARRGEDALVKAAEAGYAGGELNLRELLDAYRSRVEDEEMQLELELDAKLAEIHLDALRGRVE